MSITTSTSASTLGHTNSSGDGKGSGVVLSHKSGKHESNAPMDFHEMLTEPPSLMYGGARPSQHFVDGDGSGGSTEPRMTPTRFMAFVAMSFLWTASQIPLYLYGGIPPEIYDDIGGADQWVWFITGNLLASAAVCPFSGALSDLLGRRWVAIIGISFVIVGQVMCATAMVMGTFIAGMTISGVGAGINELTALAGTAEMAPTSQRGKYVAALILTILPFLPSVLWAQLIAASAGWRYVCLMSTLWSFLGLLAVAFFYFPPPRINSMGLSRREVVKRIDFVGGALSISGIVLFTTGLLWGGYQYPWSSARVLSCLIIGALLTTAFVCWEIWGTDYPMFPRHIGPATKDLVVTFVITFISGANFFSVLMLWPGQAVNVYGHDPVEVGIRGLPFAFGVFGGAVITLYLMSLLKGQVRWLCIAASCLMTAGCGAMAAARIDNINAVYGILFLAGLGVGGIVIPASLLSTIIVPDDVIATISALTLAVRVIGGALGFTIYYNVFVDKLEPALVEYVGTACVQNGITDLHVIEEIIELTGASLIERILPLVGGDVEIYQEIIMAGQMAFEVAYPWVYYCSIPFGVLCIVVSVFLGDISDYMDDHVAVMIV